MFRRSSAVEGSGRKTQAGTESFIGLRRRTLLHQSGNQPQCIHESETSVGGWFCHQLHSDVWFKAIRCVAPCAVPVPTPVFMSISDQLKEAFEIISSLTTMTRDEFADEYRKGGMERVNQLLAEAQVPPWE